MPRKDGNKTTVARCDSARLGRENEAKICGCAKMVYYIKAIN